MDGNERKSQLSELINLAMDCMGNAVTIIDTKGNLLYYNQYSAKILDRKTEYIGTDIHSHHKVECGMMNAAIHQMAAHIKVPNDNSAG